MNSSAASIEELPPAWLRKAVATLWQIPSLGPHKLIHAPEFVELRDQCAANYPSVGSKYKTALSKDALSLALDHALKALGLPASLSQARRRLAFPADLAAVRLHAAFERVETSRVYLCPLDGAGDLLDLSFGPNRIAKLAAPELENLVDWPRLQRIDANWTFDAQRFSQFTWLVIRETSPLEVSPQERAFPQLFHKFRRDWGAIEPHRRRYPECVELALFAISLTPWEDWVDMPEVYWRAFEVRWAYQIDDDIFIRPAAPPSPDSLQWGPPVLDDEDEPVWGTEQPERTPLNGGEASARDWLNHTRWRKIERARQTALFEAPLVYFFVKALLEPEPIDEFLAHVMAIEAALLLEDERSRLTKLAAQRVAALLRAPNEGKVYEHLYNIRCAFVHGRKMEAIPGDDRLLARQLARRVVNALVEAALDTSCPLSREYFLKGLHS